MSPLSPDTIAMANNPTNKLLTHAVLDVWKQPDVLLAIQLCSDPKSTSKGLLNVVQLASSMKRPFKIVVKQRRGGYTKRKSTAMLAGDLLLFIDAPNSLADAFNFYELIPQHLKDLFSEHLKLQNIFALRTAVLIIEGATGERVVYCLRMTETVVEEEADILELMGPEETARGSALVAETVEEMEARCVVQVERERALCVTRVNKMNAFSVRVAAMDKKDRVKRQKEFERVSVENERVLVENRQLYEAIERGKFCLAGAALRVNDAMAKQYLSECDARQENASSQESQAARLRAEATSREERAGRERAEALISDEQAGRQRADALTRNAQDGQQRSDALIRSAQDGQLRSDDLAREAQAGQQRANRRIRQLEDENEALRAEKKAWTSQHPRASASLDNPCPHTPPPPTGLLRAAKRILGMDQKQASRD